MKSKNIIYYFSATGNSLVIANDLARELGGADVISIPHALNKGIDTDYDRVGIVFPVYMFGVPLIVARFLKQFVVKDHAYVFAVANYGGIAGGALTTTRRILKERGIKLDAGFGIVMPGNYTPLYGAIPGDKQKEIFDKEKARAKEIAGIIMKKTTGILEKKPSFINRMLCDFIYWGGASQVPGSDKGFWVTDKCTSCGLCEKVCPVANISMDNGKPRWLHHCESCLACLQWCPVEAIQYKKSTLGKKRYHHPNIKAVEIVREH